MKQFWHELCIQAHIHRFELWALVLVSTLWVLLAELVFSRTVLDLVVYCSFGWFVLGKIFVPWTEQKLKQLFN
jgi:hypothetical protein